MDPYSYVRQAPTSYADPSGQFPWAIILAVIAIIAAAYAVAKAAKCACDCLSALIALMKVSGQCQIPFKTTNEAIQWLMNTPEWKRAMNVCPAWVMGFIVQKP